MAKDNYQITRSEIVRQLVEQYRHAQPPDQAALREVIAKVYAQALRDTDNISDITLKVQFGDLQEIASSGDFDSNAVAVAKALAEPIVSPIQEAGNALKNSPPVSGREFALTMTAPVVDLVMNPLRNIERAQKVVAVAGNVVEDAWEFGARELGFPTDKERLRLAEIYDLPYEARLKALHGVTLKDTATMVSIGSAPGLLANEINVTNELLTAKRALGGLGQLSVPINSLMPALITGSAETDAQNIPALMASKAIALPGNTPSTSVLPDNSVTNPALPDWDTYAKLLGSGSQPPKLKPLRDFSDLMLYQPPKVFDDASRLIYEHSPAHKIYMNLVHHMDNAFPPNIKFTVVDYLVRADEALSPQAGTGPEIFHSGMSLIQRHGVKIDRIDSEWIGGGELSANYDVFTKALAEGATIKEAVALTPAGRWAADAGFTEVGGHRFIYAMNMPTLPRVLHLEFTRPVFSVDQAFQAYGEAWIISQGRPRVNLVFRHDHPSGKLPQSALSTLDEHLQQLPLAQLEVCIGCIQENLNKQFEKSVSESDIEPELK